MKKAFTIRVCFLWILLIGVGEGLLLSCSTTEHLPEGEVLYTGVSDIAFGHKSDKVRPDNQDVEKGVITALNEAYEKVESALTGKGYQEKTLDMDDLTEWERDSIKSAQEQLDEAANTVKEEVRAVLSIAPNNSLMGSAKYRFPLPIGLWFYNGFVDSEKKFGKWIFNTFATTPKLISTVNPELRSKVALNVLHNYGFFRGQVEYDILPEKDPRKAKVAYSVYPQQQYRLDSIDIQHFPPAADSLMRAHQDETLLHRGDPFTAAALDAERNRLNKLFRDNGFYYCQPTFFTYRADTLQRRNWVQLQIRPSQQMASSTGQRFYLRNTYIHLVDPLRKGVEPTDTTGRRGSIKMLYTADKPGQKSSVRLGVFRRNIFYAKGDLYRQRMMDFVQERTSGLGIFSQVQMQCTPADTTHTCDSLDVHLYAVLDKPYDSEFKTMVTTKNNGFTGPQLRFAMTKRNAFRGAESLGFEVHGSHEWQTGSNVQGPSRLMNSYEYGVSLNYEYPYIKLGKLGRKINRNAISSTEFRLEADWLNRAGYFGRVSFGTRVTLSYQRKPTVKHEFTPFSLDYDVQLYTTDSYDSLLFINPALGVSMRNQFVPSMQYVLSMSSPRKSSHKRNFTLTLKEAGNVVSGIYSCFGRGFFEEEKNLFGVSFAQYVKGIAEYTDKVKLGSSPVSLCSRVILGAIYCYGNSYIAPYNDLFTVGGANSIRAFSIRSIGPGNYNPANSMFSYVDQVGDLKFETNLECRFPIVGNLNGAVFLDCGNVWSFDYFGDGFDGVFSFKNLGKELALGTGLGLRYDLDFLVVRFDLGIGIHAPYDTGKPGYYNMTSFGKSLGYHLAIGYPF